MTAPRSSTGWVLTVCGLLAAVGFTAALLLLDGGGGSAAARWLSGRSGAPSSPAWEGEALEPPVPRPQPDEDLTPADALVGEDVSGKDQATHTAERLLSKATRQGLALGEKARGPQGGTAMRDFDTRATVQLKPRAVPRGPLAFLTLTTVNPAAVTVTEGDESLGLTPLNNVPVLTGTRTFRLVDNRGIPRRLELTFEHGATLERLKLDVSALPKWEP